MHAPTTLDAPPGADLAARRPPERAVGLLVAGLVAGSLAMLAWEWAARRLLHLQTIPTSRQQRSLIVAQMGIWFALCASATAWLYVRTRRVRVEGWVPERLRGEAGPGIWWLGVTLVFAMTHGPRIIPATALATALFVGYRAASGRLEGYFRTGQVPAIALGLWAASLGPRWPELWGSVEFWSTVQLWSGVALAIALAAVAAWARRARPSSRLADAAGSLALVPVLALEVPRFSDYPFLLLGAMAYVASAFVAGAASEPSRARRRWGVVVVASAFLPLITAPFDPGYLASALVAGSAVAMMIHAVAFPAVVRASERVPGGLRGGLGFASAAAAAVVLPYASTAALGAGLGLYDHLFPAAGPGPDVAPPDRRPARDARLVAALMALAVVARLAFWAATDRVWEDSLITIRHAENAVAGRGLTHHPAHGRVHGFTSPLSVLVPLAGELVRPGSGLLALRIASVVAGAAAVWFAGQVARHPDIALSTPATIFWLAYLALDHTQIAFGMAGMETQVWTCVLLGGVAALVYGRLHWLAAALALAALSRPEGVVWIACALAGCLVRHGWKAALRVAAGMVAGVLPWVAFATVYYGSPVPNTIRAKSVGYLHGTAVTMRYANFPSFAVSELANNMWYVVGLLPPYFVGYGTLPIQTTWLSGSIAAVLVGLGTAGLVSLVRARTWPIPVFLLGITPYFLLVVRVVFGWYPPPILGLAALLAATGIDVAVRVLLPGRGRAASWALGLGLAALFVVPLPRTFATERFIQDLIEDGVRKRTGLWLQAHAEPGEYVAAECLGYLGYYSRLPFHDYPGLCSPRAVAALKTTRGVDRFISPIVQVLRPTWLVLRDSERAHASAEYELVHSVAIDMSQVPRYRWRIWGPSIDTRLDIYRRVGSSHANAGLPGPHPSRSPD